MSERANAVPGDPDWCGHAFASLRTWTCADCCRPVQAAVRAYLEATPSVLPSGYVWMLEIGEQDDVDDDGETRTWTLGVFSDRSRIAALLVRRSFVSGRDLRDRLRSIHWYQGALNRYIFEGWADEPDRRGDFGYYYVTAEKIDAPGALVEGRRS